MISWLRYVPHDQVHAFLEKGWEVVEILRAPRKPFRTQ